MTTSTRARWPFLVAAALAAVAVTLYYVWPFGGGDAFAGDTPTAAQARPAEQLVAALPAVPGSTRDLYDTACNAPTEYCVTSPSLSARQFAMAIRALLVDRGATNPNHFSCSHDNCLTEVVFRGVMMIIWARDARSFGGVRRPARAFVTVDRPYEAPPPNRPLAGWRTLRLFPLAWGTPSCAAPAGAGCRTYQGNLTLRMPLAQAIPAVRSRLVSWGLAIDAARCTLSAVHPGCFYAGMKFRSVGGRDLVTVGVAIHPGTTVHDDSSGHRRHLTGPASRSARAAGRDRLPAHGGPADHRRAGGQTLARHRGHRFRR